LSFCTTAHAQTVDFDRKLKELNIVLPDAQAPPAANYVKPVRVGNVLYLSGHAAVSGFRGKLGKEHERREQGYQAARLDGGCLRRSRRCCRSWAISTK
jgi:hypothetical protein